MRKNGITRYLLAIFLDKAELALGVNLQEVHRGSLVEVGL
jgi:hypothetical protein